MSSRNVVQLAAVSRTEPELTYPVPKQEELRERAAEAIINAARRLLTYDSATPLLSWRVQRESCS
jgi:hypothetical protein